MPNVEFNNENQYSRMRYSAPSNGSSSGLVGMVIKTGLAKDIKGANKVLIIVAIVAAVLAVYVFWNTVKGPSSGGNVVSPAVQQPI